MCEDTDGYWLVIYRDDDGKIRVVNTWHKAEADKFAKGVAVIKVCHTSELLHRLGVTQ